MHVVVDQYVLVHVSVLIMMKDVARSVTPYLIA